MEETSQTSLCCTVSLKKIYLYAEWIKKKENQFFEKRKSVFFLPSQSTPFPVKPSLH
jgi:catabolite regulation protein CreA